MAAPSTSITLSDGTLITMGMRDPGPGQGVPPYLKVHVARADPTKNTGAIPLPTDDGVAIATQLGLGMLADADAKLLADTIAKVRV
jgi:hypothetical protein